VGSEAVRAAIATIEESIALLRGLLVDPAVLVLGQGHAAATPLPEPDTLPAGVSIDRLWRVASAYKRLALATCPNRPGAAPHAGSWARTKDALACTARWYDASRLAAGPKERRRHGALANRLAAELCLRWHQGHSGSLLPKDEARALLAEALRSAREDAYMSPSFWTVADYGDLQLLDVLFSARPKAEDGRQVLDLYRRASELGSEEQLRLVRDQVDFLAVMAGSSVPDRALCLRGIQDGLSRIDESAGSTP
jgi:hypothetical protein